MGGLAQASVAERRSRRTRENGVERIRGGGFVKISTSEIRAIVDVLCRHLEATGRTELEIHRDFYWSVPNEAEVPDDPGELTVGSLADEWEWLKGMVADEDKALGYGFVWLGAVLREVGRETVH
jgi:hypothetical protein